jgi:hydrogenase maturation protease
VSIPALARQRSRRILIACIGNIFLGDDGFGVEVAQRLMNRESKQYPDGVQVVDFGIRGIDLAYTLLEDYDTLMLVDSLVDELVAMKM